LKLSCKGESDVTANDNPTATPGDDVGDYLAAANGCYDEYVASGQDPNFDFNPSGDDCMVLLQQVRLMSLLLNDLNAMREVMTSLSTANP
jgi:hypothetical protein